MKSEIPGFFLSVDLEHVGPRVILDRLQDDLDTVGDRLTSNRARRYSCKVRLVAGASVAAAVVVAGCGTQADPFTASPADEADALSMALLACTIYERPVSDNETLRFDELRVNMQKAAATASEAAYLDPRWRTLADALPFVAEWALIKDYEADPGQELAAWARQEETRMGIYLRVVKAECSTAEEMQKRYGSIED